MKESKLWSWFETRHSLWLGFLDCFLILSESFVSQLFPVWGSVSNRLQLGRYMGTTSSHILASIFVVVYLRLYNGTNMSESIEGDVPVFSVWESVLNWELTSGRRFLGETSHRAEERERDGRLFSSPPPSHNAQQDDFSELIFFNYGPWMWGYNDWWKSVGVLLEAKSILIYQV